jgi:MinD-like ATPase involved in chromosome partitioning or flagellar assembly
MDYERTEKELEEIFEEIQRSYKTFADDTIALQEHILDFAREVLESSVVVGQEEAGGFRAALEELAAKSRGERERFERLESKSSEAYMKVLKGPADYHHKVEEAKADLQEASPS